MSNQQTRNPNTGLSRKLTAIWIVLIAVALTVIVWFAIRESRKDSLKLLAMQGKAFTEALALAADAAMDAESNLDSWTALRYSEAIKSLTSGARKNISPEILTRLAIEHDFFGVHVVDSTGLHMGGTARGLRTDLPDFVLDEARELLANPEDRYVLLLDEDEFQEPIHYYLEISSDLNDVIVLRADAAYYVDALSRTQIGFLAQNMARETGVEYIIYQSTDGIIFASRKPGRILSIESDPFLMSALDSDSIAHRIHVMQEREVLELVRPFSSARYPFGLLRVGWPLEGYYTVSKGFDRLMVSLTGALFAIILVLFLYLNSRRQRDIIGQQFQQMKSVTDRLFENMQTGVAAIDARGRITFANDAFNRVFGLSSSEGRLWDEFAKSQSLSCEQIWSSGRDPVESEVTITEAGKESILLIAVSKLEPSQEGRSPIVAVVYDVTRLKEFEARAARQQRLSEMGDLAAGVAHEIRNPLNTISIASQRLASEFDVQQDKDEYVAITGQIRSETTRLNKIITRFLALAREESRRLQLLDLTNLINNVVEFYSGEAEGRDIEIEVDSPGEVSVLADVDGLRQILLNLFHNASEAISQKPGRIKVQVRPEGDIVHVTVGDSGPGIPAELTDKVMTPYFTTKDSGTGLGLPTVHKLVRQMGGEVRIGGSSLGGAEIGFDLKTTKASPQ